MNKYESKQMQNSLAGKVSAMMSTLPEGPGDAALELLVSTPLFEGAIAGSVLVAMIIFDSVPGN